MSDACSRLDEDERGIVLTDTPSGKQEMLIISEPGLYSLIGSSKKPEAKAFKRLRADSDEDQSIDSILEDMADAHKTSPTTIREILRLASLELQNAHSEHAFSMDGESADHVLA